MPFPYEDELLSGLLARTAARSVLKPRAAALLALGQATVCHSQFPKQVPQFCANMHLPPTECARLIWAHTHYPLIAPFLDDTNRLRLLSWMSNDCRGLGRPGSRLFAGTLYTTFRFCPECFKEQEAVFGERYWRRIWQQPQLTVCPKHGVPLHDTGVPFRDKYGISIMISPYDASTRQAVPLVKGAHEGLVLAALNDLLNGQLPQPTNEQWKRTYEELRQGRSCAEIDAAARRFWGEQWLKENRITRTTDLLHGCYFRAWWMHLALGKALAPELGMGDLIRLVASK